MSRKTRFNIAIIPQLQDRKVFVKFAHQNFAKITSGYLLGENSIPHITLCQFECEIKDEGIITKNFSDRKISRAIFPQIAGFSIIKSGSQFGKHFLGQQAAELCVIRSPEIMIAHRNAIPMIDKINCIPVNSCGDLYRPHLTLACFKSEQAQGVQMPLVLPADIFNSISFSVALGRADINWQFTGIIATQ